MWIWVSDLRKYVHKNEKAVIESYSGAPETPVSWTCSLTPYCYRL